MIRTAERAGVCVTGRLLRQRHPDQQGSLRRMRSPDLRDVALAIATLSPPKERNRPPARWRSDCATPHSRQLLTSNGRSSRRMTNNPARHNADDGPQPIQDGRGASIMGPRNPSLERENPDLLASPYTDAGTIPNLKFSYATARNRLTTGGWAPPVTVRELPVATTLAGVNMRLKPGGIREMHWHKDAEWASMLAGRCRITAVDQNGRNFIDDVGVGDLWNFPAGIPHSLQGLEDGCEFLLVFDDGNFSENETFLLPDWLKHTPRTVLAQNFGVPQAAFANLPTDPDYQRYIFNGTVPGPLTTDAVRAPAGTVPQTFSH